MRKLLCAPLVALLVACAGTPTPDQIRAWNDFVAATIDDVQAVYGDDWAVDMDPDLRFSVLITCNLLAAASTSQTDWPPEATTAVIEACQTIRTVTAPADLKNFAPDLAAMPIAAPPPPAKPGG